MAETSVATVVANLRLDNSQFKSGLSGAESAARGFGSRISRIGDIMAGVFGGQLLTTATQGLVNFFQGAFAEAQEAIKVTKETERVIESMGGVANVTAEQVEKLAERLSNKTAIDDEAIQSGANLLLTFGNIRNELGKGNKVFDRATKLAVDMSTVFKQDLKASSIQLGKALNDPIAGLTSLSRIGVQFTEQQKEQIKTLVESGDVLGAQKVILAEVARQVGGAAEAAATPFEKLQVRFKNLQEEIGMKMMPVLVRLADWFNREGLPAVERFVKWVEQNWPKWSKAVQDAWHVVEPIYSALIEQVVGFVQLADDLLNGRWGEIWGDVVEIVENAVGFLVAPMVAMYRLFEGVIKDIADAVWNVLKPPFDWIRAAVDGITGAVNFMAGIAKGAFDNFKGAAIDLWNVASVPLNALWGVLQKIVDAARDVKNVLKDMPNPLETPGGGGFFGNPFDPGDWGWPFRAAGGPVTAGAPYVVGEKGPELFVPNASGQIVPNGGAMGGGFQVTQYITAPDPVGAGNESVRRFRAEAYLAGVT